MPSTCNCRKDGRERIFEREFEDHVVVKISPNVHLGLEWVLQEEGTATVKWDGSCCTIIDGVFIRDMMRKEERRYQMVQSNVNFQRNPYHMEQDKLIKHGQDVIDVERTFEGIRDYLENNYMEGIVFWKDGEPRCKIKRKDFGFDWNKVK